MPQATDKAERLWKKLRVCVDCSQKLCANAGKLGMHKFPQQTLRPQRRLRGCIDCSQQQAGYVKSKQTLKPQKRLEDCIEIAQKLCLDASKLGMPQAMDKAEKLC